MICIYEDKFQPFTEHNRIIYSKLKEKFGEKNVFLSMEKSKHDYMTVEKRMYLSEKYFGISKFLTLDEKTVEKIKENTINSNTPIVFFSEVVKKDNIIESYDNLVPNNIYNSKCPDGLMFGKKNFNNDVLPSYMNKIDRGDKIFNLFNKLFPNQTADSLYNVYFDLVLEMTSSGGVASATKPLFLSRKQFKKFGEVRQLTPKKIKKNSGGTYNHTIPEGVDKDKIFVIGITGDIFKLGKHGKVTMIENEDIPNDAFFINI